MNAKHLRTSTAIRASFVLAAAVALVSCTVGGPENAANQVAAGPSNSEPPIEGPPRKFRELTQEQYLNTLAYVFGPDVQVDPHFPPRERTDGLVALGSAHGGISTTQLELYQKAAFNLAQLITDPDRRSFLMTCKPAKEAGADPHCAQRFLSHVGRLLHRRPLTQGELQTYVKQASDAANELNDFYKGLAVALETMLITADVLFVAEESEPDPKAPGKLRLGDYSLASRLSFFLWNAAPDEELLRAAESGELQTSKGRAIQVDRMLASPRLEKGMRAFFDDMFAFDSFSALSKDTQMYPLFTGVTASDAREETLRVTIDHLLIQKGDYRDLFTTRDTFITPRLAAVYKVPAQQGWSRYRFPDNSPRAGIVSHVSFLALHSHPARSSPTMRGKALRELLLCQPVPPPPANVDFSAVENPKGTLRTARDRVNAHLENPVCAGCHRITDPMGLALENFDGAGFYRETERGQAIDASGTLDGKAFGNPVGLAAALHDHPSLPSCLTRRVYSYAVGASLPNADRPLLAHFTAKFSEAGYRLPALLREIAMSEAFTRVSAPPTPPQNGAKTAANTAAGPLQGH